MAEHKIVHWELMGPDGDKLAAFYGDLFGWNLTPSPGFDAYHMTDEEETGISGAVGQGNKNMPQYQTIYVQVDSVDEHLAKAEGAGGTAVVPRTVIPGMVTFGLFTDPAGNLVGLVEAETPPGE
jgi:predicted enzyme related to lactoylglutathione lyase